MKMNIKIVLVLTLCLLLTAPGFSRAAGFSLIVNKFLINPDVAPVVEGRNVLVPLRAVAEAVGAEVFYEENQRAVIVKKQGLDVRVWVGKHTGVKNGSEIFLVDPPKIINDRTFVSREELSKILNVKTFLSVRLSSVVVEG